MISYVIKRSRMTSYDILKLPYYHMVSCYTLISYVIIWSIISYDMFSFDVIPLSYEWVGPLAPGLLGDEGFENRMTLRKLPLNTLHYTLSRNQ